MTLDTTTPPPTNDLEAVTRVRLVLDALATQVLERDCLVAILDSPGRPFPLDSVTEVGPRVECLGAGRRELLELLVVRAAAEGLELESNLEVIEPPFWTHRCQVLRIPGTSTARAYYVTFWDVREEPRMDFPEEATKIAEFEHHSARNVRMTVERFTRALGIEIHGSWRESPAA